MRLLSIKSLIISVALFCTMGITQIASAGGPLFNCNSGQPFVWGAGGTAIPFNPDLGGLGALSNAQAVALVTKSAKQPE